MYIADVQDILYIGINGIIINVRINEFIFKTLIFLQSIQGKENNNSHAIIVHSLLLLPEIIRITE